jgi:hypothetical protein
MFRDVKDGSAVLLLGEERDGLWQVARVCAVDGADLAVKIAHTQKEVKASLESVFPLVQLQLPGDAIPS